MKRKELSENEALAIRGAGNPKRTGGRNLLIEDLKTKSYTELVDIFKIRIYDRYINAAEFIDKNCDYNFIVTIICFVILDLWSQYAYGSPSSSPDVFKRFFREYFSEYNKPIKPPIKSCFYSYRDHKWLEEIINDVADGIYHCFRCGVVHSGMILEYGRINKNNPEVIKIEEWVKSRREINVNPSALLQKIKEKFDDYILELKSDKSALKENFGKKFKADLGIEVVGRNLFHWYL